MKARKRNLIHELTMVVIIGLATVSMTLAWFYNNKLVNSNEVNVVSIEATGFRISVDGINYKINDTIPLPENVQLRPISGNGTKFYLPRQTQGASGVDESTTWSALSYDENGDINYYYKQTIYFQAIAPGYIKLDSLVVEPCAQGNELFSKNSSNVVRRATSSLYKQYDFSKGYFSKDYIAAAARVYFKTEQSTNDLMYLPLDDVSISFEDLGNGKQRVTVDEEATPVAIADCIFYNGSSEDYYTSLPGVSFYRDSTTTSALTITELKEDTGVGVGEEKRYLSAIDVYIWIEGYDNEALDCLAGGMFNIRMRFSFEKKDAE